jgi:lysyl-tRNA synthetase class 2
VSKINILKDRAALLQAARSFFFERGILEVDCPALTQAAPIDLHIDVMEVPVTASQTGYLHTSPEYGMKRLLAAQIGDIYQLSHVFRSGEVGPLHNPEFTMAEWYRLGISFEEMIEETLAFIRLSLGDLPSNMMSYRQTFAHYLGIDLSTVTRNELEALARLHGLDIPAHAAAWDKDTLLQLLLGLVIEPNLGKEELFVIAYFPSSQAALSKVILRNGEEVACRFEVYYKGIELANGYHELTDAHEQRRRLIASNTARKQAGKPELKMDERFLEALERGLPDCCGVAVGFDRLMLLRHQKNHLNEVLPFAWDEA